MCDKIVIGADHAIPPKGASVCTIPSSKPFSVSPMTPAQLLMRLWSKVQELHPDMKFQIVPFENTPENAREILGNL